MVRDARQSVFSECWRYAQLTGGSGGAWEDTDGASKQDEMAHKIRQAESGRMTRGAREERGEVGTGRRT